MRLASMSFEGYKPFADPTHLELRPLTVLFGSNGSGKSAVLRLVPLLMQALTAERNPGLPLNVKGLAYGVDFSDLIHRHMPHGAMSLGATFEDEGDSWQFRAKLQSRHDPISQKVIQVVDEFSSVFNDEAPIVLTWDRVASQIQKQDVYKECANPVRFHGLLPSGYQLFPESWHAKLMDYAASLTHIGPIRRLDGRHFPLSANAEATIARDGSNAAIILNQYRDLMLADVRAWFMREELGKRSLDLEHIGPVFEIHLKRGSDANHLVDVGQGLNQVFPVVVQRLAPLGQPRMEVIEEPESHLHPGAHGAVADLFIRGIDQPNLQMLAETHSEMFLLRLRRSVAEGKVDPRKIGLYFVEDDGIASQLVLMEMDELGEVNGWPMEVFAEDYHEALALRRAQTARSRG